MIDIEKINTAFEEYVSNYDMNKNKIKLKHDHTYRVCEQSLAICDSLGLGEEDRNLAYLIALLHDIGRFEQATRYDTFSDLKSFDHGDFGSNLLFEEGLIRKFIEDTKYDEIIRKAVKNHNKYAIEDGLSDRELLHAKIVRDADKIDIMYINSYEYNVDNNDSIISDKIKEEFFSNQSVLIINKNTINDGVITLLSFGFDLNYNYSFKTIRDKNYINLFYNKLKNKDIFKEYFDYMNQYIERKCNNARYEIFS